MDVEEVADANMRQKTGGGPFPRRSVGGCAPDITAPAKYKLFKNQEVVPCLQAE